MKCDTEKEKTLEQDAWGFFFLFWGKKEFLCLDLNHFFHNRLLFVRELKN